MPEIKNIAVIGAGALGSLYASQFYAAQGFSTVFIAKDQRLEKLKREGVVVNGVHCPIPAISPSQASEPADLILVALKHHQLQDAVSDLGGLVGPATLFLSVMNGLESEETLGALYGMDKVLYAIALQVDAVRVGNQTHYTRAGTIHFGEAQNATLSPRVLAVQAAFTRAGIRWQTPADMLRMLWWKFMINVGVNQASAVLRAPYGVFQANREAQALMEALMQEVVVLAQHQQINLTSQDILDWYTVQSALSPQGKTSMLQDIEAQRQTEVDIFAGKVVTLGKASGIATPVNQTVAHIIRAMEQNPGGFAS